MWIRERVLVKINLGGKSMDVLRRNRPQNLVVRLSGAASKEKCGAFFWLSVDAGVRKAVDDFFSTYT